MKTRKDIVSLKLKTSDYNFGLVCMDLTQKRKNSGLEICNHLDLLPKKLAENRQVSRLALEHLKRKKELRKTPPYAFESDPIILKSKEYYS
jgi:hypothetical protein